MSFPQQGVALFVIQDSSTHKGPVSSGRVTLEASVATLITTGWEPEGTRKAPKGSQWSPAFFLTAAGTKQ